MSRFNPYVEILPPAQRQLWPLLKPSRALGLVLYGGTAVGLRLGHRQSIDFDFFTEKPLSQDLLRKELPFLRRAQVLRDRPNTLTVLAAPADSGQDAVKISFFGGLDFGRMGEPEITADGVLEVASLSDLLATKLKVLLQRIEAKDYRDIAAMLEAGVPLEKGLAGAAQMYGPAFQPAECLKALGFFEGGDLRSLALREREILIRAAQQVRDLPAVTLLPGLSATSGQGQPEF